MGESRSADERTIPIGWAFGFSLVVHGALLLLFTWLATFSIPRVVAEPVAPILFDLTPLSDGDEPGPVVPAGVPLDPTLRPAPVSAPPSPPPPSRAVEFAEPRDESGLNAELPTAREIAEEAVVPPPRETGTVEPSPSPTTDARGHSIDLRQDLRRYGQALSEAARQRPADAVASEGGDSVFVPDLSQIPSAGFGVGNLRFESRDFDWDDYGRQIYMAIWRAWHNRLWQTTDEFEKWAHQRGTWLLHHSTRVRFVIERNGDVVGIRQEASSDCLPLDQSALDALAEVVLPPLPREFPRDREVVHATFIAQGEIRSLRPSLNALKRAGYF